MVQRTCSVDGCVRPYCAKGWCQLHYRRWWSTGSTELREGTRLGRPPVPLSKRFWSRVDFSSPDDCWLWRGARVGKYGEVKWGKRPVLVHRAAYEMVYGEIPRDKVVCHTCDTPLCVRPDHLVIGTDADNVEDMWAKGRAAAQQGPTP